jgi:uncharacterized protein (TIGR02217 family)
MSVHEILLPEGYAYDTLSGPGFGSYVEPQDSGRFYRVSRGNPAARSYTVHYKNRTQAEANEILRFFSLRRGVNHAFLFKDFRDCTTSQDGFSAPDDEDVNLGTQAANTYNVQLKKKYSSGGIDYWWNIKKPVAGTVVLAYGGAPITSGWTLNETAGIVTFTSPVGTLEDLTFGCEFYVPVFFSMETANGGLTFVGSDSLHWDVGDIVLYETFTNVTQRQSSYSGGAKFIDMGGSGHTLVATDPEIIFVQADSPQDLTMPAPPSSPHDIAGSPIKLLYNVGSVGTITVKDDLATTIGTLSAGSYGRGTEVFLTDDGGLAWDGAWAS